MYSPYINTVLSTTVPLYPHQMNNKVYLNLKHNLEDSVVDKCFSRYGLIIGVYEILEKKDGFIEAENMDGSAIFNVLFSVRLCAPLERQQIICKVEKINKSLIKAENGPILVIITPDRNNDKIFFKDHNDNIRFNSQDGSEMLKMGDFVKITLETVRFNDGDDKIKCIGILDNVATEDEIKLFYQDQYANSDNDTIEYKDYVKGHEDHIVSSETTDTNENPLVDNVVEKVVERKISKKKNPKKK